MSNLNVYLCGQKTFGRLTLEMLLDEDGVNVVGVSAPVKSGSRWDTLWAAAERAGLPLMEAGVLRASSLPQNTDLIIAAHSHDFIGRLTRGACKLGAIGYHPSLLPRHRGRDAVKWTIKMGDPVAGGSVFWLNDNVDGGAVAAQDWCFVRPNDTAGELWRRELQPMGVRLLKRVLAQLKRGVIVAVEQDEKLATWEPSFGSAPLFRPELPQIGVGLNGYTVVKNLSPTSPASPHVG